MSAAKTGRRLKLNIFFCQALLWLVSSLPFCEILEPTGMLTGPVQADLETRSPSVEPACQGPLVPVTFLSPLSNIVFLL